MRGTGIVFSRFLQVEIDTGIMIGMAVVFVYAVLGGMKGITYTQVAQYCVMIFAFTVPALFLTFSMTGHLLPQTGLGATLNNGMSVLDHLDGLVTELGFASFTELHVRHVRGQRPLRVSFFLVLASLRLALSSALTLVAMIGGVVGFYLVADQTNPLFAQLSCPQLGKEVVQVSVE